GQFELSYGMIFSIILIAVFIVVAFIVIKSFLGTSCTTETGQILTDLQKNVDEIWSGAGIENFTFKRGLQGNCGVEYFCFYNVNKEITPKYDDFSTALKERSDGSGNKHNLYLYPPSKTKIPSIYLKHITFDNLKDNPSCIKFEDGVIEIKLSKGLRESLVRVN
ncbi:MAG: hypothetical protein AABX03_04435, partial [Nanoarchaeota archaeon]